VTELQQKERQLIALYSEMAALTNQECAKCDPPYSCCDFYGGYYCERAIEWADVNWGVTLDRLAIVPNLPLMGLSGCTVEPHLRPICALHVCSVNMYGKKLDDEPWTEKYFALRKRIEDLEEEVHGFRFPALKPNRGHK
jgi:hypothetical protein